MTSSATQRDDEAAGAILYEASAGRSLPGAVDGADALLRPADRFTDEERGRPAIGWLNQGIESRPDRIHPVGRRRRIARTTAHVSEPKAEASQSYSATDFAGLAERNYDQARIAFDTLLDAARATADTVRRVAELSIISTGIPSRGFDYAEQNVDAVFKFAKRLVRVRSMEEAMQLQAEFIRTQIDTLQAQTKEFGSLSQNAMQQGTEQVKSATQQSTVEARQGVENRLQNAQSAFNKNY